MSSTAVVDVEHHAVAEELERRRKPEVRFHERHKEERLAVEADVVVHVDVVADAEEMPHPVLVAEIEPARDAVVGEVEVGRGRELELLARGTVGGDVDFLRIAALERGRDEEIHHRAELELGLLGVAEHGHGAPPLEMRRGVGSCGICRNCRAIGLRQAGHRKQCPDEHGGNKCLGACRHGFQFR